jgi:uncharacterized membrane protein
MESRTLAQALYGWVVVAVAVGSVLIVFGNRLTARIGTVIIIIGLVSLMPAFRYLWWDDSSEKTTDDAATAESVEVIDAADDGERS